jgi:hypothetical protein
MTFLQAIAVQGRKNKVMSFNKLAKISKKCELCGMNNQIEAIYCNQCNNLHHLCPECIGANSEKLKIRPVYKTTLFYKNLMRWT